MTTETTENTSTASQAAKKTARKAPAHRRGHAARKVANVRNPKRLKGAAAKAVKKAAKKKPTAKAGIPTAARMVKNAELRAKILGILNFTGDRLTVAEVLEKLSSYMKNWKAPVQAVRQTMIHMSESGLIGSDREGRLHYFWSLKSNHAKAKDGVTKPRLVPMKTRAVVTGAPDVTMEYVRKTGRMRIQFGKTLVEIGVVDE